MSIPTSYLVKIHPQEEAVSCRNTGRMSASISWKCERYYCTQVQMRSSLHVRRNQTSVRFFAPLSGSKALRMPSQSNPCCGTVRHRAPKTHFHYSSPSSSSSLVASMLDFFGLDLAGRSAFTRAPLVPSADASPTSWPCARSSALSSGMILRRALY